MVRASVLLAHLQKFRPERGLRSIVFGGSFLVGPHPGIVVILFGAKRIVAGLAIGRLYLRHLRGLSLGEMPFWGRVTQGGNRASFAGLMAGTRFGALEMAPAAGRGRWRRLGRGSRAGRRACRWNRRGVVGIGRIAELSDLAEVLPVVPTGASHWRRGFDFPQTNNAHPDVRWIWMVG